MKIAKRALYGMPSVTPEHAFVRGSPLPLGAHCAKDGVNFALFSRHATRVWLLLFDGVTATEPFQTIELDSRHHRTGDIWHVRVLGASRGLVYAYRVDGPHHPEKGHRFDAGKVLIDPCAMALTSPRHLDFGEICHPARAADEADRNAPAIVKCLVATNGFDWEDDRPLYHPWSNLVIYETHVRGLDPNQ